MVAYFAMVGGSLISDPATTLATAWNPPYAPRGEGCLRAERCTSKLPPPTNTAI